MPRLPRISMQGILYYITCRAPERQKLFRDEEDYRIYLDLLAHAKEDYVMSLFSYALLPNHLHLVVELGPGANISDMMQLVNNAYTKHFNSKYHRKGPVFHGRYQITYVEKEPYLVRLTRHVHRNPTALKLVEEPEGYEYSSCAAYARPDLYTSVEGRPDLKDEVKEVLLLLDDPCRGGYARAVKMIDRDRRDLHRRLHRGGLVGSQAFVEWMKDRMEQGKIADAGEPGAVRKRSAGRVWARRMALVGTAAAVVLMMFGSGLLYIRMSTMKEDLEEDFDKKYRLLLLDKELEIRRKDKELAEHRKGGGLGGGLGAARVASIGLPEDLDGSVWTVRVVPASGGASGTVREDVLTFRDGKITSRRMRGQQFPTTNYTITRRDSRKMVWETLQAGKDGAYACWRGEVRNEKMRGVMIIKRPKKEVETFSFESRKVEFPL